MKIFDCFKNHKVENRFNLLPDGIFILENDGKIIDVNDKVLEFYNTTRFNILGHYFSDFVENGTSILEDVVQNNTRVFVNSTSNEDCPSMLFELSAAKQIETSRVYVCIRLVDSIQQQKMLELDETKEKYAAAKKIVDGKNDFLVDASGSILSSLVSIKGFSRALIDGFAGELNEKQKKYLSIINTYANSLNYDLEHLFKLFELESNPINKNNKVFDIVTLIKSIERVYAKDFKDKKIIFNLNYSQIIKRDCFLDSEIVEYILRCVFEIFLRFSDLGKCFLNIGHPPLDFLESWDFRAKDELKSEKYVLFEAKVTDLVFNEDELNNIFNAYYKSADKLINKRPIGLGATFNLLKIYIRNFGGEIKVYSKQNFGTMITFVLPLKEV